MLLAVETYFESEMVVSLHYLIRPDRQYKSHFSHDAPLTLGKPEKQNLGWCEFVTVLISSCLYVGKIRVFLVNPCNKKQLVALLSNGGGFMYIHKALAHNWQKGTKWHTIVRTELKDLSKSHMNVGPVQFCRDIHVATLLRYQQDMQALRGRCTTAQIDINGVALLFARSYIVIGLRHGLHQDCMSYHGLSP